MQSIKDEPKEYSRAIEMMKGSRTNIRNDGSSTSSNHVFSKCSRLCGVAATDKDLWFDVGMAWRLWLAHEHYFGVLVIAGWWDWDSLKTTVKSPMSAFEAAVGTQTGAWLTSFKADSLMLKVRKAHVLYRESISFAIIHVRWLYALFLNSHAEWMGRGLANKRNWLNPLIPYVLVE